MADIGTMQEQLQALEAQVGSSVSMVAAFDGELSRMRETMVFTGREVNTLSSGISGGLRKAFDGLVFDGMKLSDALKTVANTIVDTIYSIAIKPVTGALGGFIAQGLAGMMGGDVRAESEPGQGSVFHASVLAARAAAAEPAEFLQRDAPALVGKRILIVDDNQTNRRILSKLAMQWGMRPSTLPSAAEAIDRIRDGEAFDVAVLDMSMPGIDGMGLASEIRRWRNAQALPIVMLTTESQDSKKAEGKSAGATGWIVKPFKPEQLIAVVKKVLG